MLCAIFFFNTKKYSFAARVRLRKISNPFAGRIHKHIIPKLKGPARNMKNARGQWSAQRHLHMSRRAVRRCSKTRRWRSFTRQYEFPFFGTFLFLLPEKLSYFVKVVCFNPLSVRTRNEPTFCWHNECLVFFNFYLFEENKETLPRIPILWRDTLLQRTYSCKRASCVYLLDGLHNIQPVKPESYTACICARTISEV